MKLFQLLLPSVPLLLRHPVLGLVEWRSIPVQGWGLYWHRGPEQGQVLAADETVLLCNQWEVGTNDAG